MSGFEPLRRLYAYMLWYSALPGSRASPSLRIDCAPAQSLRSEAWAARSRTGSTGLPLASVSAAANDAPGASRTARINGRDCIFMCSLDCGSPDFPIAAIYTHHEETGCRPANRTLRVANSGRLGGIPRAAEVARRSAPGACQPRCGDAGRRRGLGCQSWRHERRAAAARAPARRERARAQLRRARLVAAVDALG